MKKLLGALVLGLSSPLWAQAAGLGPPAVLQRAEPDPRSHSLRGDAGGDLRHVWELTRAADVPGPDQLAAERVERTHGA